MELLRTFDVSDGTTITLKIKLPERVSEREFRCYYHLSGSYIRSSYAPGADSIQAFILCLRKIEVDIESWSRDRDVSVSWMGRSDGNELGLR